MFLLFKKYFLNFLSLFCISCLCTCTTPPAVPANISFYHWKTNLNLQSAELNYLDSLQTRKLYLRFFDIDWDFNTNQAIPLATIEFDQSLPKHLQIVPTLFITNRTFLQLTKDKLPNLIDKVHQKITFLASQFKGHQILEIQIDCDWSAKTRSIYFEF